MVQFHPPSGRLSPQQATNCKQNPYHHGEKRTDDVRPKVEKSAFRLPREYLSPECPMAPPTDEQGESKGRKCASNC